MTPETYEDCVRALTGCGREHTHISLPYLASIVDDLVGEGKFRAAVTIAYQSGLACTQADRDMEIDDLRRQLAACEQERDDARYVLDARDKEIAELEEQGSALTRELELKTREAEADRSHAAEMEYVAAQRLEENDHLRARIAELESQPVSAPPAVPGSRDFRLRGQDVHGWSQVADEDPTAIDAALNGHEPTSFIEGGAA